MKGISKSLLFLAGMTLLLVGCQKEGKVNIGDGSVRFTAATAPQTKTAYGDYDNANAPTWQRIDWKAGDLIRIASDKATHRYEARNWSDYVVTADGTADGRQSKANIENVPGDGTGNGLVWDEAATTDHIFWAMYPATGTTESNLTAGNLSMTIPDLQNPAEEMQYAYMFARTTAGLPTTKYEKNVTLYFKPAFTAFEFHLTSLDDEIELVDFTLESAASNLSGTLVAKITGADTEADLNLGETPAISDGKNAITIKFPAGTKITKGGDEQVFTLFALPQTYNDLTLKFNIKVNGTPETRTFPLKNASGFIPFNAFNKHRITGLRMPGGMWRLTINGEVLPWNGYASTVEAAVSVQPIIPGGPSAVITGDIERKYMEADVNYKNHYKAAYDYPKYYQIRTLDRSEGAPGYFTMQFLPTAPAGGYWQLIPMYKDGDTESPKHFRFEVSRPGGEVSDQLTGPILDAIWTIKIYPKDYDPSDINVYEVYFTAIFSPSKTFNPAINADSEFQDVHSDGRFSYWTFRLTQDQSKISQE